MRLRKILLHTDGKPRRTDQPTGAKTRWTKALNTGVPAAVALPEAEREYQQTSLIGVADAS